MTDSCPCECCVRRRILKFESIHHCKCRPYGEVACTCPFCTGAVATKRYENPRLDHD